jgi:hypothetical protein
MVLPVCYSEAAGHPDVLATGFESGIAYRPPQVFGDLHRAGLPMTRQQAKLFAAQPAADVIEPLNDRSLAVSARSPAS